MSYVSFLVKKCFLKKLSKKQNNKSIALQSNKLGQEGGGGGEASCVSYPQELHSSDV